MNCDCLKDISESIKSAEPGKYERVEIIETMFHFGTGKSYTMSSIEARLVKPQGRKKTDKMSIAHSYCPFCGKKTGINTKRKSA